MLLQEAVQQFVFEAVICISSGFCGPNAMHCSAMIAMLFESATLNYVLIKGCVC
jgi:hypothetical protein